jgi:hypothetical protein
LGYHCGANRELRISIPAVPSDLPVPNNMPYLNPDSLGTDFANSFTVQPMRVASFSALNMQLLL